MGAFFTNVQVFGGTDPAQTRARVIEAITRRLHEQGMVEPGQGEEPDRSVLVGPGGRWISVYDEASEGQNEDTLREMAEQLSAVLGVAAVTVLVHDSDVLRLALFESGRRLAEYDSNPEFFGGKKPRKISVTEWARFLAPGRTATDLRQVMQEEKLFAEDTLARVAALIDIEAAQISIGYSYAEKADPKYAALHFRSKVRPASEQLSQGGPKLEMGAHCPTLELSVGAPLRAGFSVRNAGGASKGIQVVAWGEALASRSIVLRDAQLIIGSPVSSAAAPKNWPVAPFEARTSKNGDQMWVASFPEVELPAGVTLGVESLLGIDPRKMVDVMYRSSVHANITGEVLVAGESELGIGFLPREAAASGQYGYSCRVRAHPASRRPRRCPADAEAHLLRPLDDRSTLFGMASCAADIHDAANVATELIEKWGSSLPASGKYLLGVFRAAVGARPKSGSANAKAFFRSARWRKLKEELATEAAVTAERQDAKTCDPDGFPVRRSDGFAFGRSIIPRASADPADRELATLALWQSVDGQSEASVAEARDLLTTILDEFVTRAHGVQALMGRWGWQASTLDSTPYERACGVHGQCTLMRSWLTRYLRGVTDDWMWIGPDLLGHLGRAAIDVVATTVPVADGIRLRLRPGASLDELEKVLADVLPAGEDWRAAIDRYYRRR